MRPLFFISGLLIFAACKKEVIISQQTSLLKAFDSAKAARADVNFNTYTIQPGQHYCDQNVPTLISYDQLTFAVKFDSSAIYSTTNPSNQLDINKLYGFSDNNSDHHQFSARFGWRWSSNSLQLFGYTYNNGKRADKSLGNIDIGQVYNCSIKVSQHYYYFSINGKTDSLERASSTIKAEGYKLYPYFGGDEVARHIITISIKDL